MFVTTVRRISGLSRGVELPPALEEHMKNTYKEHENMATSSCQIQGDEGIQVGRVKRKDLCTQIWLLVECKTTRETLKEWHFAKENSRFDSWWSCSRASDSIHFVTNRGPRVLNKRLRLTHADKTKDTHQPCTSSSQSLFNRSSEFFFLFTLSSINTFSPLLYFTSLVELTWLHFRSIVLIIHLNEFEWIMMVVLNEIEF